MTLDHLTSLQELWEFTAELNEEHYPGNPLRPIVGGGKNISPEVMFLFINPTARNISSDPAWSGPRFPFIGTKNIWRIFSRAGLFDPNLLGRIEGMKTWSVEFAEEVYNYLEARSFYFTNIVKWTGHNADLPGTDMTRLFLPILQREIEIIKPKYIVTFGLIPFTHLTKQKIKLRDYYHRVISENRITAFNIHINQLTVGVIPCYFPVGRGDPARAVDLLKFVPQLV